MAPFIYDYPRPMVTVDAVVFAVRDDALEVLLIQRKHDPYEGQWALPGGFVDMDETLETAAARELEEETGLAGICLEQVHTFGDPGRDPRGRSISTAYVGLADPAKHTVKGGDDAADAAWFPVASLPALAFDHGLIVEYALERLRCKLRHEQGDADFFREISAEVLRACVHG